LTRQGFSLDRLRPLSYIGACILLAGCPRRPGPLVPESLAPADPDSATAWTRTTIPAGRRTIRFRWRYRDERVSYAGRGTARIAPPDSLRFDYAGPLGLGAGAAVVLGDSVAWADPEANFRSLVPAIPMLWASLGVVRPPAPEAAVFGSVESDAAGRGVWRFALDRDTLDYVVQAGTSPTLAAEWRRGAKVVARSLTQFGSGAPVSARVDFPEASARFEFTVVAIDSVAVIPAAVWRSRR
jgi:hypothetical protein